MADDSSVEEIRRSFARAWGEIGAAWGVAPSTATVQGYLLAHGGPLSRARGPPCPWPEPSRGQPGTGAVRGVGTHSARRNDASLRAARPRGHRLGSRGRPLGVVPPRGGRPVWNARRIRWCRSSSAAWRRPAPPARRVRTWSGGCPGCWSSCALRPGRETCSFGVSRMPSRVCSPCWSSWTAEPWQGCGRWSTSSSPMSWSPRWARSPSYRRPRSIGWWRWPTAGRCADCWAWPRTLDFAGAVVLEDRCAGRHRGLRLSAAQRRRAADAAGPATRRSGRPGRVCRAIPARRRGGRTSCAGWRRSRSSALGGQRPQLPLERAERLLASLVQELLVGLVGLALVGAVGDAPAHHLGRGASSGRPPLVVQDVLEAGGQVDLGGRRWSGSGGTPRPAGCCAPCCTAPARPYSSRATVEGGAACRSRCLTSATLPSGSDDAAVAGAGLDADLADRPGVPVPCSSAVVAVQVGAQLLLGRVRLPHLADLAADADRHARPAERRGSARSAPRCWPR